MKFPVFSTGLTVLRRAVRCVAQKSRPGVFYARRFPFFRPGNELLTIHGRRMQVTGRNWPRNLKSVGCRDRSAETQRRVPVFCYKHRVRAAFRGLRPRWN